MRRRRHFRLSKNQVHGLVFVGIICAAFLDRYFKLHDAAMMVSVASNAFWIFRG